MKVKTREEFNQKYNYSKCKDKELNVLLRCSHCKYCVDFEEELPIGFCSRMDGMFIRDCTIYLNHFCKLWRQKHDI